MAVWVSPLPDSLPVEPGGEAPCRLTVRNDSEIVDEFAIEVLGDAAAWSAVEPPRVSLMPGTSAEVTVTVRPPRDTTLSPGPLPVGVKVSSVERPDTSAVVEGEIEILPFSAFTMELIPRTSHGSRGGKHEIAFDNLGNRRVAVRLDASDTDGLLRFRFAPPALDAAPGTASFAKVHVRHRKRFLRGPAKLRQFVVRAEPEGGEPLIANGTAVQEALVPTWVLGALLGIAALAVLWFILFKPQIKDTAKSTADAQVLKLTGQTGKTTPTSTNPTGGGAGAGGGASGGGGGGTSGGGGSGGGTSGSGGGTSGGSGGAAGGAGGTAGAVASFSRRLEISCARSCSTSFTVPSGKTFAVNDVVLGNPNNTKGKLTVKNGGVVLFVENLDNFRDLDFHFDPGIAVNSGRTLSIGVKCAAGAPCGAAAFFSGTLG